MYSSEAIAELILPPLAVLRPLRDCGALYLGCISQLYVAGFGKPSKRLS
jgi:hypothetical protein